ncbi:SOS response-associated peptidase [Haloplasma contractile]|uniref:Abasic site processing protein n=1 Tax=Haloplasma contractile SSD-17B TaxID=1033810 RepID=U2FGY4_9MOLU|nr:SOS response-associated peptidase [Haloplasma contractile]ERJ12115.1 putative ACR protein [Haloplasma contractile SSD-17B]
MCGRYTLDISEDKLTTYLKTYYEIEQEIDHRFNLPRYNIAPGQRIITILKDGDKFRSGPLKWGFVPFWAKDEKIGYKMINAKSETLASKPSFKHAFKNKRCIILADSFYEWKKDKNGKTPMRISLKNRKLFSFAGLWSSYQKEDGTNLYTCTIITTEPNEFMESIHNRMPVILTKEQEKIWLDPYINDEEKLNTVLRPYNSNEMTAYPVSTIVNNARNETVECIKPIN